MAITYTVGTNTITVTGYTEVTPCNFTDLYNADKAGTLSLHARTGITGTDGAPVAVDRAERPTDYVVLGGASNDLYITVANWNGTTATIQITGTDRDGTAQTEDIVVTANGNYYTTKWFKTITTTQVIVFTATTFDYDLIQGQWGVVWSQGSFQFYFNGKIYLGNDSIITYFGDINKSILFEDLGGTHIYVSNYANLILGNLIDEVAKETDQGCFLYSKGTATSFIVGQAGSDSVVSLYSSKFAGAGTSYILLLIKNEGRVWNCHTDKKVSFISSHINLYQTNMYSSQYAIYNPNSNSVFDTVIIDGAKSGFRCENVEITARNVIIKNCDYAVWLQGANADYSYLIDTVVDAWNLYFSIAPNARLYRQYTLNLKILDINENNIENATVVLKDKDDNDIFSVTTNASGEIVEQTVSYGYYNEANGNTLQFYSPHTLIIKKAGYQTYTEKFTLDHTINWTIALKRIAINIDAEVIA